MPAHSSPGTAARFALTVDGYEIARFMSLSAAILPTAPPRSIQAHELAHVVQQRGGAGRVKWPPLILKRGVVEQAALGRLQSALAVNGMAVRAIDTAGKRGPGVAMPRIKVVHVSAPGAKGGGEVAIEELVLAVDC